MALEDEVLAEIRPSEEERKRVRAAAEDLLQRLREVAAERGIPAEPLLVGSVDKDTYLTDPEIDAFVAFPPDTSRKDLERWGLELGEILAEPERRYAEHPYTRGRFGEFEAEVVPCYRLDRPTARMTAVDRTPFHASYVKEAMDAEQRDQVRLLKRFLQGTGVYGAEAKVQGFSGYLCELLVLKYGSFRGVLQAAAQWRPPVHLELDREAKRSFPEDLIFVDPVDGQRNAASAVSSASLALVVLAAKEYLREPRRTFFFPEPLPSLSPEDLRALLADRGTAVLAVTAALPDVPEDVLYPQLWKAQEAVVRHLEDQGFRVLAFRAFAAEEEWGLLLELERGVLPPVRKHLGPPTWMEQTEDFLAKWTGAPDRVVGPYVEGERLVVDVRREAPRAVDALAADLPSLSLGKHLDQGVRKEFQIREGDEVATAHPGPLTAFLVRRLPWTPVRGSTLGT